MPYNLQSKMVLDTLSFLDGNTAPFAGKTSAQRAAEECAVDFALRNVQLPDGLLTRLGQLADRISEENADQVDCLGC